ADRSSGGSFNHFCAVSIISQLPPIPFRESDFKIGRGDAVSVKADELVGSTVAWHGAKLD
ncbi:MAG: hypothetical protein WA694_10980, partial [Pseudolabrys sp.]